MERGSLGSLLNLALNNKLHPSPPVSPAALLSSHLPLSCPASVCLASGGALLPNCYLCLWS